MKPFVLFFTLTLSLLVCKGQNLVKEGKLWSNTSVGTMPGSTYDSYFIKFMGDTTINGLAYKKILKSKDEYQGNWSSFGSIREETTTRKVYIYNQAANKDILLYDFSLEEGDSILTGDGHSYAKVTKVTNAAFGNSPVIRKQIYFFDTSGNTRWIEGVGSTWGVLEGLNSFFTTGATTSLVCYHENNELIYQNPRFSNCYPKISDPIMVNAGKDTTYCAGVYTTKITMGLKVNIQNGVAPYTYAWECKVPKGLYSFFTASDFLNDTTAISPHFTYFGYDTQWITFVIHVTDSENNSGKDTIRVRFSKFGYLLGYPGVEINKGDSILLGNSTIGGGIEPLKYHYQPETGLSNPDTLVTWAKPEVSTTYNIIATDSCGCVSEPNAAYYVMVKQTSSEFAPIGATWYYSDYESHNPPQANYIKHSSIKDSTINGKPVKVIQKTQFKRSGEVDLGYEYLYQNGDTIFYWKNNAFHELYNFSLAKGDSIRLYSEMPDYCENKNPYGWVEVDSVYTTMVNNHLLKSYSVTAKKGSKWDFGIHPIIEKIGSLTYLLPQNMGCVVDVPNIGLLRCYSDPELGVFHFENLPCDTITTFPDAVNLYDRSLQVKVYPNPVSNDLYIEGNFNEKEYILELYSIQGNLIKTECMEGGINLYRMDAGTLKSGSYILRIISQKGNYAERMVIKK